MDVNNLRSDRNMLPALHTRDILNVFVDGITADVKKLFDFDIMPYLKTDDITGGAQDSEGDRDRD